MAALLLLVTAAAAASLGDLTRRETGDVFTILGDECGPAQCAEHGAGAANSKDASIAGGCACACPQRAPLFREDRELCVDDLPECALATFGTGNALQRIPFVFLPLKGQIIHPSREITFKNVKTPICAVSGAQFLTTKGFLDLRNTLDADVPFSLFRDEGRTFLQWSGEDEVRARMSGRVMVVRLLCRDVAAAPSSPLDLRGVFTPCVAFRVQGTPPRHATNITEVQFTPNAQTSDSSASSGLSASEYIAIGISSLLLGLIYVASVFLYLHIRKRRKVASEESSLRRIKGLKKKDGTITVDRDILRINNERVQTISNAMGQDDGVIKNNPLLSVGRPFSDKINFTSDSGSNLSDSEDMPDSSIRSEENVFNKRTTSAIIHLHNEGLKSQYEGMEVNHRDESGIERLPDEHVSIVETIEDREITRPVGTTRRKLYFNPAYFEPQFMVDPPAAALEFLSKIREVISIAKQKMAAKRFHPVLNEIPEEETYPSNANSIDLYHGLGSQRSGSVVSLKRENSRRRSSTCLGCPGCKSDNSTVNVIKYDIPNCKNCLHSKGDKQSSIRKWLENIPNGPEEVNEDFDNNSRILAKSLSSLPIAACRNNIRKQYSFSESHSLYSNENMTPSKKCASRSVRSEPSTKNYNIPLPEFEGATCEDNIVTKKIVQSINFDDYRPNSCGSKSSCKRRNTLINNKNSLPDMVNDAMALDNFSKSYNQSSSDDEMLTENLDNDATEKAFNHSSESPTANDYETDSLERSSNKKNLSTPTEFLEVPSSQASPSLSNALPLEEELTMRNAVYKSNSMSESNTPSPDVEVGVNQNHYETIDIKKNTGLKDADKSFGVNYSLVSEVYVNNSYNFGSAPTSPSGSESSIGSRKLIALQNVEEKPGCLTIEVKDPPENYIRIHESDGFEPDTLDRKHPKHKESLENVQFSRRDLIKNLASPNIKNSQRIQLRSSGTFVKNTHKIDHNPKFNSLRGDYECNKIIQTRPKIAPNMFSTNSQEDTSDKSWEDSGGWTSEEGRILTLELRHSKRQRQCTPPTAKQFKSLARPDILPPLPPTEDSIYEKPVIPPRRVENCTVEVDVPQKCLSDRSLSPSELKISSEDSNVQSNIPKSINEGPSCSPIHASIQSHPTDYEDIKAVNSINCVSLSIEACRNSTRRNSSRSSSGINTHTFVKDTKFDKAKQRRKKGLSIEDSGYLSSDSTSSRHFQRKLVIAKLASCSDSDDTGNEARSESGAESVETHSVYFGSFRNLPQRAENSNIKSARSNKVKVKN
ncbi:uncharacterized protein LOC119831609 [Zerene cesonia]|uniref:uncharacterized protein LOC119831609 n=1 Tax=Zerene cesonia TaxID=33412 RepID=UPI0018E4F120|nr:uncharacterized protein LOC119831609 [Zerene cesonia]